MNKNDKTGYVVDIDLGGVPPDSTAIKIITALCSFVAMQAFQKMFEIPIGALLEEIGEKSLALDKFKKHLMDAQKVAIAISANGPEQDGDGASIPVLGTVAIQDKTLYFEVRREVHAAVVARELPLLRKLA